MSPVFGHGQLRLYLLALLAEGPRHGYEVIRALEERFEGMYTPSAGTVYPRLARLERDGLVVRADQGRKAVYRLTDAGRAEVEARAADIATLERDIVRSVRSLADEARARVRTDVSQLRAELAGAARAARREARPADGRRGPADRTARGGDGGPTGGGPTGGGPTGGSPGGGPTGGGPSGGNPGGGPGGGDPGQGDPGPDGARSSLAGIEAALRELGDEAHLAATTSLAAADGVRLALERLTRELRSLGRPRGGGSP